VVFHELAYGLARMPAGRKKRLTSTATEDFR